MWGTDEHVSCELALWAILRSQHICNPSNVTFSVPTSNMSLFKAKTFISWLHIPILQIILFPETLHNIFIQVRSMLKAIAISILVSSNGPLFKVIFSHFRFTLLNPMIYFQQSLCQYIIGRNERWCLNTSICQSISPAYIRNHFDYLLHQTV